MVKTTLGIIGGGQLGSMLATAAKRIDIKTVIFCDDADAPAQRFSDEFIFGKYDDQNAIEKFVSASDVITFEFENIPFNTLNEINKIKSVLPHPSINKIVQNRITEKYFINKLNIRTTQYVSIKKKSELEHVTLYIKNNLKDFNYKIWVRLPIVAHRPSEKITSQLAVDFLLAAARWASDAAPLYSPS